MTQPPDIASLDRKLSDFIDEQRKFNAEQRKFNAEQRKFNERIDKSVGELTVSVGELKGFHALAAALRRTDSVARSLGLRQFHVLSQGEIAELANGLRGLDVNPGICEEFANADIIIEAHDANRGKHYIAAQVSYTADRGDAERAQRNADLLRQLTEDQCHAVVMGCVKGPGVAEAETLGKVVWYHVSNRAMAPR